MSCQHGLDETIKPPLTSESVHKDDCTQCFDDIDSEFGVNVCLSCFNAGCTAKERDHARNHYLLSQHPLALNIKRSKWPRAEQEEPPQKLSKLAIPAESDDDKYTISTRVFCYPCAASIDEINENVSRAVDGVLSATSYSKQTEVKAWEQEIVPCEHTRCLQQEQSRQLQSQALAHCSKCDLQENLWLCLQCGNLACGRQQFGGVGGNGHGLDHYDEANHPVAVKLGSITPEGTADVYCYACNDERQDTALAAHLSYWGINIADRQKTEKSLTEMQIDQNLKWEFSMTTEDGTELQPVFGPGFTGLKNLGNSCYMSSSLQCLFASEPFAERYYLPSHNLPETLDPASDFETQLRKMGDGLLSGRYSKPDEPEATADSNERPHQKGVAPVIFKALVGRGHAEFSTMRQQDAMEFVLHLFKLINRSRHPQGMSDPTDHFRFATEERLQCMKCRRVRYRTEIQDNLSIPVPALQKEILDGHVAYESVTLEQCLESFTDNEILDYTCPACGDTQSASKQIMFQTYPDYLMINARRFGLVNWVPTKLEIPVQVGEAEVDLSKFVSKGLQPGEELLPEDSATESGPVPNAAALEQLEGMAFPRVRCEKALFATGNVDAELAMNWLFEHMEDPDIDVPVTNWAGAQYEPLGEQIDMLTGMGFATGKAERALRETNGDTERAVDWLFNHTDGNGDDETPAEQSSTTPGRNDVSPVYQLRSMMCHKGVGINMVSS